MWPPPVWDAESALTLYLHECCPRHGSGSPTTTSPQLSAKEGTCWLSLDGLQLSILRARPSPSQLRPPCFLVHLGSPLGCPRTCAICPELSKSTHWNPGSGACLSSVVVSRLWSLLKSFHLNAVSWKSSHYTRRSALSETQPRNFL